MSVQKHPTPQYKASVMKLDCIAVSELLPIKANNGCEPFITGSSVKSCSVKQEQYNCIIKKLSVISPVENRPTTVIITYKENPDEWRFWMYDIGFGEVFDWIGFLWRQPYINGEKSWLSKKTMYSIINNRHSVCENYQLPLFTSCY